MPTPMREIDLGETYLGFEAKKMRSKWLIRHATREVYDDVDGDGNQRSYEYDMHWYLCELDEDGRIIWSDSMFDDPVLVFTKREADRYVEENGLEAEVIELLKAARA